MPVASNSHFPPSAEQSAVCARGLTKRYGNNIAVHAVDLDVMPGQILGIFGPDGAGKTALLQMLAGIAKPTSGSTTIFGAPVKSARRQCGYVTQQFTMPEDLTVEENMRYAAELREIDRAHYSAQAENLLQMTGLSKFKTRLAGKLSGGMKEKLAIACALVTKPKVLFLDEPTTGVDVVACRELQNLFVQLSHQGTAVILATPNFAELEICDQIAFIHQGKIYDRGTPSAVRKSAQATIQSVTTESSVRHVNPPNQSSAQIL